MIKLFQNEDGSFRLLEVRHTSCLHKERKELYIPGSTVRFVSAACNGQMPFPKRKAMR